jgi:uncharacterized linocin/CFP29 family protein
MLTNIKVNQPRVNSTRGSDFTLRETSMLSLNYQTTDTLILSITETWLSRLETEEELKFGTSISNQELSGQD